MPEMHLKQPDFTYSPCGLFAKNKERIEKFMQTGNTKYILKNDLDKTYFQHDMADGKYKDLNKRTQFDKVLRETAFEIASNTKYDGYQRWLALMVCKCFDKNLNQQLSYELNKTIITKFEKEEFILPLKATFEVQI